MQPAGWNKTSWLQLLWFRLLRGTYGPVLSIWLVWENGLPGIILHSSWHPAHPNQNPFPQRNEMSPGNSFNGANSPEILMRQACSDRTQLNCNWATMETAKVWISCIEDIEDSTASPHPGLLAACLTKLTNSNMLHLYHARLPLAVLFHAIAQTVQNFMLPGF